MSDPISDEAVARLQDLARKARGQPLRVSHGTTPTARVVVLDADGTVVAAFRERADAELYALAAPATILALLLRLQRAEADNAALRGTISGVASEIQDSLADDATSAEIRMRGALDDCDRALRTPHPGAALFERHAREVDAAWNAAVEAMVAQLDSTRAKAKALGCHGEAAVLADARDDIRALKRPTP